MAVVASILRIRTPYRVGYVESHSVGVGTVGLVVADVVAKSWMRMSEGVRRRRWHAVASSLLAVGLVLAGCSASVRTSDDSVSVAIDPGFVPTTLATSSSTSTTAPTTTASTGVAPTTVAAATATSSRDRLAVLAIDDRPRPSGTYRREDWPHWADPDGNGCDARQDALVRWSVVAATVNRSGTCKVVAGSWISPYDGKRSNNPSDFDVDHLVPLENAFVSGGWTWTAAQRRAYANDQSVLVVASASANRSKGSKAPNEWRPADRASWCAYADGWVSVKHRWSLTVTTSERDALGQMLDTCTEAGPVWPGRG